MHAGKQVVAIEIATLSGLNTGMPIKHQGLFEEVVQVRAVCARPCLAEGTRLRGPGSDL